MADTRALAAVAWLVFVVGIGVILIALVPRKSQVRSPARRAEGALSGLVFCLLAGVVILPGASGTTQKALAAGAVVAAALSWYVGRHAGKLDRAVR